MTLLATECPLKRLAARVVSWGVLFILLSGCVVEDYIRPNDESLTERWWCYTTLDWKLNLATYRSLRGKSKVRLSRSKEGGGTSGPGTVSIADVTFQAEYELMGTTRVWRYQDRGREYLFGITAADQGFSSMRGSDGEFKVLDSDLMCNSN